MDSTPLRLAAHLLTIGLLLAAICAIVLAQGKALHWRYWRLLVAVLTVWLLWFIGLAVSVRGTAMIPRETLTWTLGILELTGAVGGWLWWWLTVRASFRLTARSTGSLVVAR